MLGHPPLDNQMVPHSEGIFKVSFRKKRTLQRFKFPRDLELKWLNINCLVNTEPFLFLRCLAALSALLADEWMPPSDHLV